jgi:type IV secretory pathway VirB2 component (pilin)
MKHWRRIRWTVAAALSMLVAAGWAAVPAGPAAAVSVPYEGVSYYITTNSPSKLYDLGCQMGDLDYSRAGTQHALVVLEFGGPTTVNGVQGATLYDGPNSTNSQILAAVKEYAHGYWVCAGTDTTSVVEVGIGTNNSTGNSNVTNASGKAWAQMVSSFATWLGTVSYGNQVLAAGANDIEPGFGAAANARAWVDGYASAYTRRLLNNGSADGCPSSHLPGSTECGTGTHPEWGPEDIYHVSWGSAPSYPLPQIYLTDSVQAQQWYWLSRYAVSSHGSAMSFAGSTTQRRDCAGDSSCTPAGQAGTNNTVSAGYTQLYNALAQNSATAMTPPGTTDFAGYY